MYGKKTSLAVNAARPYFSQNKYFNSGMIEMVEHKRMDK